MNKLFNLLKSLYCIRFFAKDIHYAAKGTEFFSDHLLADRVADGLDNFIDDINENLYLGFEEKAPTSAEVLLGVVDSLFVAKDDIKKNWETLYNYIKETEELIYKIEEEYDIPQVNSLLDSIADDLQKKKGLIWRRIL
ncbi:MAG: hypothetical protein J6S85_03020 [Methanobrevibacter sp.]|nr:hypothetical protein [Methanobrevibacter sp.]